MTEAERADERAGLLHVLEYARSTRALISVFAQGQQCRARRRRRSVRLVGTVVRLGERGFTIAVGPRERLVFFGDVVRVHEAPPREARR